MEEKEKTFVSVNQKASWEVADGGQVYTDSQGPKWDSRRAQSVLALKHLGPFSAGFLTASVMSCATKCLILF